MYLLGGRASRRKRCGATLGLGVPRHYVRLGYSNTSTRTEARSRITSWELENVKLGQCLGPVSIIVYTTLYILYVVRPVIQYQEILEKRDAT